MIIKTGLGLRGYFIGIAGSIMPLTALMLPLILGMTGFGVDISVWLSNKRNLQSAADAAAIAAAWEIANNYDEADLDELDLDEDLVGQLEEEEDGEIGYPQYAALKEAVKNGFESSRGNMDFRYYSDEDGNQRVTVALEQEEDLYFSIAVFTGDVYTSAAAATVVILPTGDYCLLALDTTAEGAIRSVGSVEIEAEECGMAVNSNSDEALQLSGSVDITMKDVHIAGDLDVTGGSANFDYESLETDAGRVPDPYADLDVPEYGGCDYRNTRIRSSRTIDPGVYCGGIDIMSSGNIVMNPGVYIMDCGNFSMTGGGTLEGENVSIILSCSSDVDNTGRIDVSGNPEIDLSAPESGDEMEGVPVYRDRDAPSSNQCNRITGTASVLLDGAVYIPSDCFRIGGNAGADSPDSDPCTRIIAKTIELHGNPNMRNQCDGSAARDIGRISIRLVL